MNRKNFLRNAMMAFPALQLAGLEKFSSGTKEPFVIRAGKNRSGDPMMKYMGVHPNDVIISKHDTDGALSVFLFTGYGVVGTPLHIHDEQDEFFTIIEGRYKFVCGNITTELNAGDSIFLPRKVAHQWLQLSEKGSVIYAVNPAGGLEDFFRAANELKEPTPEKIDALALKFGMKHIGPPLTK
jgi:mannose-6-phosphate isomerase-like protein (cupin superfamily)